MIRFGRKTAATKAHIAAGEWLVTFGRDRFDSPNAELVRVKEWIRSDAGGWLAIVGGRSLVLKLSLGGYSCGKWKTSLDREHRVATVGRLWIEW